MKPCSARQAQFRWGLAKSMTGLIPVDYVGGFQLSTIQLAMSCYHHGRLDRSRRVVHSQGINCDLVCGEAPRK